ncbi:hypothetical protein BDY17DRAFT_132265 [Neohortaea acidophila]|uniref:Filamentation protein n=1 Tax=Neohortaea acidophila TaxID=245834 RepID=A0A6A6PX62_9PEZI|nr:uncharacterized protein BDY17DRAFT_132265 [Neohortaea acidophila]KAF2484622.1 hypothetical protein BDY17DRAFT_132265 [Neohortaea acidophila]
MSVTSAAPATGKGATYFAQLDQALCNGNWSEIAELARKTEKHASQRKCFTLAARSEAQISSILQRQTSSTSPVDGIGDLISKLSEATSNIRDDRYPEDVYVAKTCLAEIYHLQNDHTKALEAVPKESRPTSSASARASPLGWTEVCEVKTEYIKLVALIESGKEQDARTMCLEIATRTPGSRTPELRRWTERLLARACLVTKISTGEPTVQSLSQSLRCFSAWSDFWQRSPAAASAARATTSKLDTPRRNVWRAHYELLSTILHYGLTYNTSSRSASDLLIMPSEIPAGEDRTVARVRQRIAMRRVESNYESLLLNETQFPKASQINTEVEEWVQRAVANWKILSGPAWSDAELGEGGKESAGRNVLDILYRAATKTFHSTTILRNLFTVHAALGEFDLAMHAFNSFVEIISKDKARAERKESSDVKIHPDDTAVLVAAEAVRILCRYGDRDQGVKAVEVGHTIKKWLDEAKHPASIKDAVHSAGGGSTDSRAESGLKSTTLAAGYRAIGTGQANRARMIEDTHARPELQAEALENLRLAHDYDRESIETAYALALLLAETRDVPDAIQVLKRAIASPGPVGEDDEEDETDDFARERLLLPVWHLLALCLTASDGYEQAARMCEAAFEQFGDSATLYGHSEQRNSAEYGEKGDLPNGLVDQMEGYEKETILQIKMTQITLFELTEGAEMAVDASYELLGLYARLFGNLNTRRPTTAQPPPTAVSATPTKRGGTLRSLAGSIRSKPGRASMERDPRTGSRASIVPRRPDAANGANETPRTDDNVGLPIAITVTNEDGVATEKSHHHMHLPFRRRDHGGLKTTGSISSMRKPSERLSTLMEKTTSPPSPATNNETLAEKSVPPENDSSKLATAPTQPLGEMAHNISKDALPHPPGHEQQPPEQDVRLPAPHPSTNLVPDARLPTVQDRQQRFTLLVKIWLFTAGLYLRAELLDDASSAIDEAHQLVGAFEIEVGAELSSARRFFDKGWGGGNSVDALWAETWSAKGYLALARTQPFLAIDNFEQALAHSPDHAEAILGLSNLLLDIYEEKIPAEEPRPSLTQRPTSSNPTINGPIPAAPDIPPNPPSTTTNAEQNPTPAPTQSTTPNPRRRQNKDPTPAELNRLASRDRAYMLLSHLTRLGSGWDSAEAWSSLARAYELSRQVSKAKEALWWVVELEGGAPVRQWKEVGAGGFTL